MPECDCRAWHFQRLSVDPALDTPHQNGDVALSLCQNSPHRILAVHLNFQPHTQQSHVLHTLQFLTTLEPLNSQSPTQHPQNVRRIQRPRPARDRQASRGRPKLTHREARPRCQHLVGPWEGGQRLQCVPITITITPFPLPLSPSTWPLRPSAATSIGRSFPFSV